MFRYHTTKDGQTMLICEMDDQHLVNTILLLEKKFQEIKTFSEDNVTNDYERYLYNRKVITSKELAEKTKDIAELIAPYVLEAVLRGIQITLTVQRMFGRKERVQPVQNFNLLTSNLSDDSYWEDVELNDDDEF